MSTKPGADTWRTDGGGGSPIHTLAHDRSEDRRIHPAIDKPPDTLHRLSRWRSRTETGEASWGTAAGAPLTLPIGAC
jgi:hypothetical protein